METKQALVADVVLHTGETREEWALDVLSKGFRVEAKGKNEDPDFRGKDFARRIAPNRIIAVDYELG
jgi:hypothetical protein